MPSRSAIELTKAVLARMFPNANEGQLDEAARTMVRWSAAGVIDQLDSDQTRQRLIWEFEFLLGTESDYTAGAREAERDGLPSEDVPWRRRHGPDREP